MQEKIVDFHIFLVIFFPFFNFPKNNFFSVILTIFFFFLMVYNKHYKDCVFVFVFQSSGFLLWIFFIFLFDWIFDGLEAMNVVSAAYAKLRCCDVSCHKLHATKSHVLLHFWEDPPPVSVGPAFLWKGTHLQLQFLRFFLLFSYSNFWPRYQRNLLYFTTKKK